MIEEKRVSLLWVVAIFLAVDAIVIGSLLRFAAQTWNEVGADYPRLPPEPDAISHRFQSISIELFNLGLSAHCTCDRTYLHIDPAWILRLLGARAMSVPIQDIAVIQTNRLGTKVKIHHHELRLPNRVMRSKT